MEKYSYPSLFLLTTGVLDCKFAFIAWHTEISQSTLHNESAM